MKKMWNWITKILVGEEEAPYVGFRPVWVYGVGIDSERIEEAMEGRR